MKKKSRIKKFLDKNPKLRNPYFYISVIGLIFSAAGVEYDIECVLKKGVAITIIEEKKAKDGGTWCRALSKYWVNKKYLDFVRYK